MNEIQSASRPTDRHLISKRTACGTRTRREGRARGPTRTMAGYEPREVIRIGSKGLDEKVFDEEEPLGTYRPSTPERLEILPFGGCRRGGRSPVQVL